MKNSALFPGSFDPITIGHYDIITRALPMFSSIVVGIGNNTSKKYLYTLAQRESMVKQVFAAHPQVSVISYSGLTVDVCKQHNISYILRGLRTSNDFDFERAIAHINHSLMPDVETIFLLTSQQYASVSSSIVRDIISNGGEPGLFLPPGLKLPNA